MGDATEVTLPAEPVEVKKGIRWLEAKTLNDNAEFRRTDGDKRTVYAKTGDRRISGFKVLHWE